MQGCEEEVGVGHWHEKCRKKNRVAVGNEVKETWYPESESGVEVEKTKTPESESGDGVKKLSCQSWRTETVSKSWNPGAEVASGSRKK